MSESESGQVAEEDGHESDQKVESDGSENKSRALSKQGSNDKGEDDKSDSDGYSKDVNRSKPLIGGIAFGGPSSHRVSLFPRSSMLSRREAKRPNIVGASRTLAAQRTSFKAGLLKHPAVKYSISASQQESSKPFFTKWNEFQRKNWGKGWSREEMRKKYKVLWEAYKNHRRLNFRQDLGRTHYFKSIGRNC